MEKQEKRNKNKQNPGQAADTKNKLAKPWKKQQKRSKHRAKPKGKSTQTDQKLTKSNEKQHIQNLFSIY